jgi:hypothetical protein
MPGICLVLLVFVFELVVLEWRSVLLELSLPEEALLTLPLPPAAEPGRDVRVVLLLVEPVPEREDDDEEEAETTERLKDEPPLAFSRRSTGLYSGAAKPLMVLVS